MHSKTCASRHVPRSGPVLHYSSGDLKGQYTPTGKTLGPPWIRHRSETFTSNRRRPIVFAIWDAMLCFFLFQPEHIVEQTDELLAIF